MGLQPGHPDAVLVAWMGRVGWSLAVASEAVNFPIGILAARDISHVWLCVAQLVTRMQEYTEYVIYYA